MIEDVHSAGEPHSRLTYLCDAMIDTFVSHPCHQSDDMAIILTLDSEFGGIVLHNFDDEETAMTALILHLKAMFAAHGKELIIAPIGRG